jgi:aminomethyltransferase
MNDVIKKTPLHAWHVANGAIMADFGGYEMPLWYGSVINEHLSAVATAGIFDTSHMALVLVSGPQAYHLLQWCFSRDMDAVVAENRDADAAGRCCYGVFLNDKGEVIDDSIVYKFAGDQYIAVVNAGMGPAISAHLTANNADFSAVVKDLTDQVGKIDVQGPHAAKIIAQVLEDPQTAFKNLPYFAFKGHFDPTSGSADSVRLRDGTPILLSRTGYTGEFGFEIFVTSELVVKLWKEILDTGQDLGIVACGLAARDSLRGGAVLPLSHQDIGPWLFVNNPWSFALPFTSDQKGFTKTFIGDNALLNVKAPEYTYAFVGNDLRKVSTQDPALVLDDKDNEIGRVLTCVSDMAIGRHQDRIYSIASPGKPQGFKPKGLCCGFVKVTTKLAIGQTIYIKDNRRKLRVAVTDDIRPDRTARRPMKEML